MVGVLVNMVEQSKSRSGIRAVRTTFAIVELLEDVEGAGVSRVAKELSISKSTAYDHLMTLLDLEYIIKQKNIYYPSLKFLKHGRYAQFNTNLYIESKPVIVRVAEETDTAVWIAVEEHGQAVYINKALGRRAVPSRGAIGARVPLHSAAIGKAIMAHLPDDKCMEIIDKHGLAELTKNTITESEKLLEELKENKKSGVAFNNEESLIGLGGIASPIITNNEVIGAVGVAGTNNQMNAGEYHEQMPKILKEAANEIALNVTYDLEE